LPGSSTPNARRIWTRSADSLRPSRRMPSEGLGNLDRPGLRTPSLVERHKPGSFLPGCHRRITESGRRYWRVSAPVRSP
jgi:hypothetical protein